MKTEKQKYFPKEVMRDLFSMQKFLPEFLKLGKDYNDIIKYILSININDDSVPYPSLKEILKTTGITYAVLSRKLIRLYEDVIKHDELGIEFRINKIEYVFCLEYFHNRLYVTLNDIPIIPRVGEQIFFPFFRSTIGTDYFHIRRIDHYFDDTKQSIHFDLVFGNYNLFWHLKKDEEYEKRHISLEDYYSSNDYKLKEKFVDRRR